MIKSISKNKLAKIVVLFILIFTVSNFSFAVEKVKIEYFGRKDCKNCTNLEKFLENCLTKEKILNMLNIKLMKVMKIKIYLMK